MTVNELKKFATDVRIETVKCLEARTFGHIGGCLSIADVLTVLYNGELKNIDPKNPKKPDRDMLVVSKGHAGPAVFATLALKGYFPLDWLPTLCEGGTRLPSHCDRIRTPGIDASTGSLGQGLSLANGFAHAAKIKDKKNRIYCLMGDGEIQEGQIWEAAMYAHQYKLNNLVGIVDWNKKQIDGTVDECISLLDIAEKFRAFGWYAVTVKGDDIEAIQMAFKQIRENQSDKPGVLVLDGVKGSGVKCIEEMKFNHMIPVDKELADQCLEELEAGMMIPLAACVVQAGHPFR